jgi:hypothetical protein
MAASAIYSCFADAIKGFIKINFEIMPKVIILTFI